MLTRLQHDLLRLIHDRLRETGVAPSYDEMRQAMGRVSKSSVHRLVCALEERGFIRRVRGRARAIEVIRAPFSAVPAVPAPRSSAGAEDACAVPLMGRISSGTPVEAVQKQIRLVSVPADMLSPGEHFALEVRGDSMIEAGILEDDLILILKAVNAETGDIVVALIDDEEVTLRRIRRKGATIALEAANVAYETRIFGPGRVRIQGRLVGLLRSYRGASSGAGTAA